MKNIFKTLSGRPKDGDVIECIRPIIVLPQIILTVIFMAIAIRYNNLTIAILSLLSAWQIGWGMSIERFKKNNK